NATAEENDGHAALFRFTQEVGPNFGFENDDNGGTDGVEKFADRKNPVEREIDDGIGEGDALLGQRVAGDGGGGNDEWPLWISVAEPFGESNAGEGFADGNGVNPDGTGTLRGQFFQFGDGKAEALPEI